MAWFECTTGASSGNGVALIVTTDASFAGSNITASNGVDTFTQQCPSSAPYVVTFEDIPTGTYTISGVTGGQTVSRTFVVSDYNFEFHGTPTGSTATPVNVIQTWLHCADIWNKSYTTINQVLADTSTLLALISSNNAADYMARSTNWSSSVCTNQTAMGYIGNNNYCANKLLANSTWRNAICNSTYFESVLNVKVPTMTSDTTPSGTASASGNSTDAYKVFDGDDTTTWYTNATPSFVQYMFASAITVGKYKLIYRNTTRGSSVKQYEILGSNDNFVNDSHSLFLSEVLPNNPTSSGHSNVTLVGILSAIGKYKYYKLAILSTHDTQNWREVVTLQFYGR